MAHCWIVVEFDVKALFCPSCRGQNWVMDVTYIEWYDSWLFSWLHVDPSYTIELYCLVCHCSQVTIVGIRV